MDNFLKLITAVLLTLLLISCAAQQSPDPDKPPEQQLPREDAKSSLGEVCRAFPEHADCKNQPASEDDDDMKRLR